MKTLLSSDELIIQKYLKGAHYSFCFDVDHLSPENEFDGTHLLEEWHSHHSMEKIYRDLERLQSILETQVVIYHLLESLDPSECSLSISTACFHHQSRLQRVSPSFCAAKRHR